MTGAVLRLSGDLASASLMSWIARRAHLLSLRGWARRDSDEDVTIAVQGPAPLIDAMETACLLGPMDVMVERIERDAATFASPPKGFEIADALS